MFLYNTLAQNVNDNIFVMAQSGSKVHRRFISKCHQRLGGNDEDKNNNNKKVQSQKKKIHRSMKHGKMIEMVATGTGARKVVMGGLLGLEHKDFSCRPCCEQHGKPASCRLSADPAAAQVVGPLWHGNTCGTRQEGTSMHRGQEGLSCPSATFHNTCLWPFADPCLYIEMGGRDTWPAGLWIGLHLGEGVSCKAWPILASRLNLSHRTNNDIVGN